MSLPVPSDWVSGPGGIKLDSLTWDQRKADYRFVDEFEQIRPLVVGPNHLDRFEYWSNTFRYLRATGTYACTAGEIDRFIKKVKADSTGDRSQYRQRAIDLRSRQMKELQNVFTLLLPTVSTNGELGNHRQLAATRHDPDSHHPGAGVRTFAEHNAAGRMLACRDHPAPGSYHRAHGPHILAPEREPETQGYSPTRRTAVTQARLEDARRKDLPIDPSGPYQPGGMAGRYSGDGHPG